METRCREQLEALAFA